MADCSSRSGFVSAAAFTTARTGCTLVGMGHVGAEDEGPESGIVQDARRIICYGWMGYRSRLWDPQGKKISIMFSCTNNYIIIMERIECIDDDIRIASLR